MESVSAHGRCWNELIFKDLSNPKNHPGSGKLGGFSCGLLRRWGGRGLISGVLVWRIAGFLWVNGNKTGSSISQWEGWEGRAAFVVPILLLLERIISTSVENTEPVAAAVTRTPPKLFIYFVFPTASSVGCRAFPHLVTPQMLSAWQPTWQKELTDIHPPSSLVISICC